MKPGVPKDPDLDGIAVDWLMRIDRGALSDTERRELDAWLSADARHRGAFARTQAVWSNVRRLGPQMDVDPAALRTSWFTGPRMRLAASILVAALIVGASGTVALGFFGGREVTDRGEIRRIALADGSSMLLNTASVAQIRFDEHERHIILRSGEASFVVAKHDRRPFTVQVHDVSVRAVGTVFAVRMREGSVAVTVDEGVVEVAAAAGAAAPSRQRHRLEAGHQLIAVESSAKSPAIETTTLADAEVARELAWREGQLIFDGDLVGKAAQEVNRYSSARVIIDDTDLQDRPMVGVFRVGDSRAFAYAVAALFNADVIEKNGNLHVRSTAR